MGSWLLEREWVPFSQEEKQAEREDCSRNGNGGPAFWGSIMLPRETLMRAVEESIPLANSELFDLDDSASGEDTQM